jgi:Zn-dependent peptidase ImmA (M78 family)
VGRRPAEEATKLLQHYQITIPPVPVERIAEQQGAQVIRQRSESPDSGFALRMDGRWIIGVNTQTSRLRQRFSIAHELGHLLLHEEQLIVSTVQVHLRSHVSSLGTDAQEIEANQFAAELLMPRKFVLDSVATQMSQKPLTRDELVHTLAREFDVSTDAMGYRLVNLGVLMA